jgi:D-sedoheptulose 7-phosphate isomerase
MERLLTRAVEELDALLPKLAALAPQLARLGEAMLRTWEGGGKVLLAGNGGSAADAMHLAEELCVRFMKTRRALAAMALCDPTVLTCAANDFGYEEVFARQVEALGNRGDVLLVFSTSGNSPNILRAIERAKSQGLITAAMLGRDGGKARGLCDVELIVPAQAPHRIQEGHKVLYHTLCEWVEETMDEQR